MWGNYDKRVTLIKMEVIINRFEEDLHRKDPRSAAYLDSMLSRFNRGLQEYGLFKELKRRAHFVKPSTKRSAKKKNKLTKSRQERKGHAVYIRELPRYIKKRTG